MQLRFWLRCAGLLCASASLSCVKSSAPDGGGSRSCDCPLSQGCDADGVCWPACTSTADCSDHECDTDLKICSKTCVRFGVGCGCVDSDEDLKGDLCDTCNANLDELDSDDDDACETCDVSSVACTLDRCPNRVGGEGDADSDTVIDCKDACTGDDRVCDADHDGYCLVSLSSPSCAPIISGKIEACPDFNDALDDDSDTNPNGCDHCPGDDRVRDADGDGFCTQCDGVSGCKLDRCPGVNDNTWDDTLSCCPNVAANDLPDPLAWNIDSALLKNNANTYYPGFSDQTLLTNNNCPSAAAEGSAGDPDCDGVDGKKSTAWFVRCGSESQGTLPRLFTSLNSALVAYKNPEILPKPDAIFVASEWNDSGTVKSCDYEEVLDLDKTVLVPIYGAFLHDFKTRDPAKRTKLYSVSNRNREIVKVDLTGTTTSQQFLLDGFLIVSEPASDVYPSAVAMTVTGTGSVGKLNLQDSIVVATPGYADSTIPTKPTTSGKDGCAGGKFTPKSSQQPENPYYCDTNYPQDENRSQPLGATNCNPVTGNYGGTGCYSDGGCCAWDWNDNRLGTDGYPTENGGTATGGQPGGSQGGDTWPTCPHGAGGGNSSSTGQNNGNGCNGAPGQQGLKGSKASSNATDVPSLAWRAFAGSAGGVGTDGTAGGGGAGGLASGGGADWGSSGTSGGAGGLKGVSGGLGGKGSGGSFPMIANAAANVALSCTALISQGGGAGQQGGAGGDGGKGGVAPEPVLGYMFGTGYSRRNPGRGGNGGAGGGGGGGAGGDGGHSVCLLFTNAGQSNTAQSAFDSGKGVCLRGAAGVNEPGLGGAGGAAGANGSPNSAGSTGETGRGGVGADVCSFDTTSSKFHKLDCTCKGIGCLLHY